MQSAKLQRPLRAALYNYLGLNLQNANMHSPMNAALYDYFDISYMEHQNTMSNES